MLAYEEIGPARFGQYESIPMALTVESVLVLEPLAGGLGGIALVERPVTPYVKDFRTHEDVGPRRWAERWDISNWAFFMALEDGHPVGGAAVAARTAGVDMLAGRDDLAVLWDIRVREEYKGRGVAGRLLDMALDWCRTRGLIQMKIECQNTNVPACRFYQRRGAVLSAIDAHAYHSAEEYRHEAQLIWYLDIDTANT